jgi:hypothetical protein
MGVSYLAFTLNDETANWLRENNLPPPSPLPHSRFPTLRELKAVVETVISCSSTSTRAVQNSLSSLLRS